MPKLRIASVNVNGIRAAVRKGMLSWLEDRSVDILTLQEVRAQDEHLAEFFPDWTFVHDEATAKGRAGVAVLMRGDFEAVRHGIGPEDFDAKGRWLEVDTRLAEQPLTVVSAYVHSGEADTPKQDEKWRFLDAMELRLAELNQNDRLVLITGDLNVGHRELDIKNWRGNRKKSGFLPRERSYFDRFLAPLGESVPTVDGSVGNGLGWIDVGRAAAGEVDGPYTWWSNRGQAFDNDTGWRIDYHLATPALAALARDYRVDRASSYDSRWSDHAPVVADYVL